MNTSRLTSLRELVECAARFSIPIYQRPYVWGQAQIETLLQDLWEAYATDQPLFYLGGALVTRRPGAAGDCLELIDGQQRFTTLWLISLLGAGPESSSAGWDNALAPWRTVDGTGELRIRFAIRPQVEAFFRGYLAGEAVPLPEEFSAIADALATIRQFFADPGRLAPAGRSWSGFTRYIYRNVRLVLTGMAPGTDLNKLFETFNNRGEQLQHHQILKARLLHLLRGEPYAGAYATLWDGCAEMDDYQERNLAAIAAAAGRRGLSVAELFGRRSAAGAPALGEACCVLEALGAREADTPMAAFSLSAILDGSAVADATCGAPLFEQAESRVRSILSFPMLLQHTLRIWLWQRDRADLPRILDRELLGLFERHFLLPPDAGPAGAEEAASFIALLWEVRYCLDRHVIKWVEHGREELQLGARLECSDSGLRRSCQAEATDELDLLQSMLYHSQEITSQYWLTPFLAWLHRHRALEGQGALACLQRLDNALFCRGDSRPLVQRSHELMQAIGRQPQADCWRAFGAGHLPPVLAQPLGVGFARYWFYKLEFVLWHFRKELGGQGDPRWTRFRLKAKNSVEHVSPQSPRGTDPAPVSAARRDHFGNLALVSRSANSELGNQPFRFKRDYFHERNLAALDSLKLELIFRNDSWGDAAVERHQQEMFAWLEAYFHRHGEDDHPTS